MQEKKQINYFGRFQFKTRLFFDTTAILVAWFLSYYLRFYVLPGGIGGTVSLFVFLSIFAVVSGFSFLYLNRLYESQITSNWRKEVSRLFIVSMETFLAFVVLYYYFFMEKVSRIQLGLFWFFLFVLLVIDRYAVNKLFAAYIKTGRFRNKVLLVGWGDKLNEYYTAATSGSEAQRLIISGQYMGNGHHVGDVPQISASSLAEAARQIDAQVIVISFPEKSAESAGLIKEGLEIFDRRVFLLPDIPKSYVGTVVADFHFIPTLELNSFNITTGKKFIKRAFDLVLCVPAVILLSPLYLLLAVIIKLDSPGPVFFRQKRVTRDGQVFEMLKFRSMYIDAQEGSAHWTEENDPRITRFGRFMRRTSLDEIPQFFNVIGGSMSLIGPRPERPELESRFIKTVPGYNMRHRMKAGISGWAQVNGLRGNTSLEKRIDFDLYYIRNWSFWFDVKIVVLTFIKGFVNKNAY